MNSNLKGNIGEAKAVAYFIENGFEVYLPFGTAVKCDMVVVKNNITQRVSVKTTSSKGKSGKYKVKIRQGKLNSQIAFNKEESDLLFVYVLPTEKSYLLKSKDIKPRFELTLI